MASTTAFTTTRPKASTSDSSSWSDELGWETLLNRAGTTFRKLPDADKDGLNERKAIALMLAQPSMIKRPVLDHRRQAAGRVQAGALRQEFARSVRGRRSLTRLAEFDHVVAESGDARTATEIEIDHGAKFDRGEVRVDRASDS